MSESAHRAHLAQVLVVAAAMCLTCSAADPAASAAGNPDPGRRVTSATEQWTRPVPLSPLSEVPDAPQLFADADGNLTAAWLDRSALDAFPPGEPQLLVSRRTADTTTWSAPEVEAPQTFRFCMGVDPAGAVTIVYAGEQEHAYVTRSVAGGAFSTLEAIATAIPGHMDSACVMGVGSDGTVTAVWPQRDRTPQGKLETRVVWVQLPAGADTWTTPRYLTRADRNTQYFLQLSVGPDDSILLTWQSTWSGPWSRLLLAGSTSWSPSKKVARNQYLDDLVNLGGGKATAMFDKGVRVVTTGRRSDGTWRPVQPIAAHRKGYQAGALLASWHRQTIALWMVGKYLEVSIRSHGRWEPAHQIVELGGEPWSAQAYPNGAIRVVWTKGRGITVRGRQLLTAVRGPHGSWGPTTPILRSSCCAIPSAQLLAPHSAAILDTNRKGRVVFSEVAAPPAMTVRGTTSSPTVTGLGADPDVRGPSARARTERTGGGGYRTHRSGSNVVFLGGGSGEVG
jgi:hypothetical protein